MIIRFPCLKRTRCQWVSTITSCCLRISTRYFAGEVVASCHARSVAVRGSTASPGELHRHCGDVVNTFPSVRDPVAASACKTERQPYGVFFFFPLHLGRLFMSPMPTWFVQWDTWLMAAWLFSMSDSTWRLKHYLKIYGNQLWEILGSVQLSYSGLNNPQK